jgi:SAM-dependent methyltransferase
VRGRAWRSRIALALSRLRLLGPADAVLRWIHVAATAPENRRFAREHPGFAVPPARLAFEALGHVSARDYHETGRAHAQVFASLIRERVPRPRPRVLEWGCGPGRIIRHLKDAGLDPRAELIGTDVDAACIAWCRGHLEGIEFRLCGTAPKLAEEDASLDAVYHYSVWTHQSQATIEAWVREIARVLRGDGVMVGTSHGDRFVDMLLPGQARAYRSGAAVEHAGFPEGRKRFLGFHPPAMLETLLLRHFERVSRLAPGAAASMPQDVWCAERPRR